MSLIDKKLYPRLAFWADQAITSAGNAAKEAMAKKAGVEIVTPPKPILSRVVENPLSWVGLGFLASGLYVLNRGRK